jgi:hypothetical protein
MIEKPTAAELRRFSAIFEPKTYFGQEGIDTFGKKDFDPGVVDDPTYHAARGILVRTCADGLLAYQNEKSEMGILLINRNGHPAKDQLWSIGGGIQRKIIGAREALKANAKRETNLDLFDIVYLGSADMAWATRPLETDVGGDGIRDFSLMFYAVGEGDLQFRELDNKPLIVTPEMWEQKQGKLADLHPYVGENLDRAIVLLIDSFYK